MLIVPTKPIPSQVVQVQLAGQPCEIRIYQLTYGMFVDLYVNGTLIIGGVICQNLNRIVRSNYLGFVGDLVFGDTEEVSDPVYTGLGSRFQLAYLESADLGG